MKEENKKGIPVSGEKSLTWDDIENFLKNSTRDGAGEGDGEMLAYFKQKILNHLDALQKKDEKIIPFL